MVQRLVRERPILTLITSFLAANLLGAVITICSVSYYVGRQDQRVVTLEAWKTQREENKLPERLAGIEATLKSNCGAIDNIQRDVEIIKRSVWSHLGEQERRLLGPMFDQGNKGKKYDREE